MRPLLLLMMLVGVVTSTSIVAPLQQTLAITQCGSDQQVVMCGQLPLDTPDAAHIYAHCCWLYAPVQLPPTAQAARDRAAAAQAAIAASVSRTDLDQGGGGRYATAPNWQWSSTAWVNGKKASTCVAKGSVTVATFSTPQQAGGVYTFSPVGLA